MKVYNLYEANIPDAEDVYLGTFVDDIGDDVYSQVLGFASTLDYVDDFGGGVRDVLCGSVVEACEGSHIKLANAAKIKRADAKKVLEYCNVV